MASIVTVHSPMGVKLATFEGAFTTRSYMSMNWDNLEFGECSFSLSTADPKCTENNITAGRIIVVEDENDELPDWVGYIDSGKGITWGNREVAIIATSMEKILTKRRTYAIQLGGTAGSCFKQLIEWVNKSVPYGMPLYPGEIWDGDFVSNITTNGDMLTIVKNISKFAGGVGGPPKDFSVTHKYNANGTLELLCNLYQWQGVQTGIDLTERNVKGLTESLIEDGEIWNYVVCYSSASTPGGRIKAEAWDDDSIAKYGLSVIAIEGVGTDEGGIKYQTASYLNRYKQPHITEPLAFLNVPISPTENMFNRIRIGNFYKRIATISGFGKHGLGHSNFVHLTSFEVNDRDKYVAGTLEVVTDYDLNRGDYWWIAEDPGAPGEDDDKL